MMEGGIGQHHAEAGLAWRHVIRDPISWSPRQQHDGPRQAGEQRCFFRFHPAQGLCLRQIAGHQGERFVLARLAGAQGMHGAGIERIAGQVVAAQSFDRQDCARVAAGVPPRAMTSCGWLPRFSRPAGPAVVPAARRPGRHWAAHGTGGLPVNRTRPGRQGTSGRTPWW